MIKDFVAFKHRSVRDLAWAISSPPLISPHISSGPGSCVWPESQWFLRLYESSLFWLQDIDEDPADLDAMLAGQKDRRLGKYFETLWYYWLRKHPRYEIIENNLQIIFDGETLGEMDFILFDKKTGRTLHWELAVKFYLGIGDTSQMSNWHGPNLRDRLDLKVEHLSHRQSIISKQPRVMQWLKQRGIQIDECRVILKGRLYYPWSDDVLSKEVSPPQCSSEHLRSRWLNTVQFESGFDEKQCFMPLINEGWLERIPTHSVKKFYYKNDIFETVSNKSLGLPLHLGLCNPASIGDRLFLVGFDWP